MNEAAHEREQARLPSAAADPDIQEALSRRYSDQVVILLRLKSGRFAVYNNLRELCGVIYEPFWEGEWPPLCWRPPPPPAIKREAKVSIDLEELGLL